ncbi:MAG: helix-turn-helix transcriptional regulator [Saprospiraceae bacterium]
MESLNGTTISLLAQNIRYLRKRQELSQEELALRVGLNRGNIASYENGTAEPKICNLLKLAQIFGIAITDLTQKDLSDNDLYESSHEAYQSNSRPLFDDTAAIFDDFVARTEELRRVIDSLHTCHQFKVKSAGQLNKEMQVMNSNFEQMYELATQALLSQQDLLEFIKCRVR